MEGVVAVVFVTEARTYTFAGHYTKKYHHQQLILAGNHIMEGVIKFGQISQTESERERGEARRTVCDQTEKAKIQYNRSSGRVRWAAIQLECR